MTGRIRGVDHELFGGYGPVVALGALILAMALLAPTVAPERDVTTRPAAPAAVRSSVTTGVSDVRTSPGGAAGVGAVRSSVTTGVSEERTPGGGRADGGGR